ncbi:MAG: hypothetical protein Q8R28_16975 [Dehalococcoidia bacterium]|nr:hypothetical protein [Dehalococcoidia bacterium]
MVAAWILNTLIGVGRRDDPEDITAISELEPIREHDHINRIWKEWDAVTCSLPTHDLIALLKGLVVAERQFRWTGGSVAAVICVFRELQRRDHTLSRELADWILPRTKNPWVPFGGDNLGARSVSEYERSLVIRAKAREARAQEAHGQNEDGQRRREDRARRATERVARQRADSALRHATITELAFLDPAVRLRRIAVDQEHSVLYYPAVFAAVEDRVLKLLDLGTRTALAERLRSHRKGPWHQLYAQLVDCLDVSSDDPATSPDEAR